MSESSTSGSSRIQNIQLIVRCALQSFEDLTVECPVNWKVAELKNHLFEVCSTKPEPNRQRLIYAGHCLKDTQLLQEIVDKASEGFDAGEEIGPQVIHLVCTSKEPQISSSSSSGLRHRNNASTTSNTAGASGNGNVAAGQQGLSMPNALPTYAFPQYQLPANATPEQMAYYASYLNYQQAMMTWMQYNQLVASPIAPQMFNAVQATPMLQAGPYNLQFNLQGAGLNNPIQQVNQNAQNNNQAPNIAGNEDEHVNDILGILYKCIRVSFFLMVLFFYSSFERFLAVFLIICILWYVHRQREQNNLNAAARRVAQPQPQQPQQARAEGDNANQLDQNENQLPRQNDNNNNELPAAQHPPVQTPWQLFSSTVSSFFLSLIPENPVPMDVRE